MLTKKSLIVLTSALLLVPVYCSAATNGSPMPVSARPGAYEAKTHLPKLLELVSKGERITITKHGVPVAVLQPVEPSRQLNTKQIIEELKVFRGQHRLNGLSIKEMVEEGRP